MRAVHNASARRRENEESGVSGATALVFENRRCFSPSGDRLFVNIQTPGITFEIEGPWEAGGL